MSEQIKVGVPVFYKPEMRWVKPTKVDGNMIWFESSRGERVWNEPDSFTYSPVIPPRPEPEVEWVEEEIAAKNVPFSDSVFYIFAGVPTDAKNIRIVFDRPKREGE